jgi:CDP-paratose 2-epimerase
MRICLVTGSAGLIGSEAVAFFAQKYDRVIGLDNDGRAYFFGPEASTRWNAKRLQAQYPNYTHLNVDIRDLAALEKIFVEYSSDIELIIHAAAQPSHDWAAREPLTDFAVNATGTLHMLELTRLHCPEAVFIFTSTNKVYGDTPNFLPLVELDTRWEIDPSHPFTRGIDEQMTIDHSKHSVFGASKVAADVLVQEYGRYFGMKTGVFRGGCLTGPHHSGAQLHGFLSYLMKCTITGTPYTIFGYKGKQVRDNIHSADLVSMFWHFAQQPGSGKVYNAGGGRYANVSMLEAITICERLVGRKLSYTLSDEARSGDHIWYVSDLGAFQRDYPTWTWTYDIEATLREMHAEMAERFAVK